MIYIADTNLIVRFLTNDDEVQSAVAKEIMKRVDNNIITLHIPDIVIMETCWVLKSIYGYNNNLISETLLKLIECEGIYTESNIIGNALELFGDKKVDLADALISLKSINQNMPVITWNTKDFKKLSCEFYKPEELIREK